MLKVVELEPKIFERMVLEAVLKIPPSPADVTISKVEEMILIEIF